MEGITLALREEELANNLGKKIALDALEMDNSTLSTSVRGFLVMLAMQGDESLKAKANEYI
ncbi:MAG: hypothetical protein ACHQUC_07255 [Chlamydiales bacterium]